MQCRLAACQAAIEGGQWGKVELKKVSVEVISFQQGAASNWPDTQTHIQIIVINDTWVCSRHREIIQMIESSKRFWSR